MFFALTMTALVAHRYAIPEHFPYRRLEHNNYEPHFDVATDNQKYLISDTTAVVGQGRELK